MIHSHIHAYDFVDNTCCHAEKQFCRLCLKQKHLIFCLEGDHQHLNQI